MLASFSFCPDVEGLSGFRKYLYATEKTPARLLVDIIEEDFRKETLPHVNSRDRKAMIDRLIDRRYRSNCDYVYYWLVGRETSGRRDDVLGISVLSNPELFKKWLDIIQEVEIPLVGIWSLPLLSTRLIELLQARDENILLVSQEVPSNLRQTFIKNGEIVNSRATVINTPHDSFGRIIQEEVEFNSRFLTNQRMIGFDDKITVHVVACQNDLDDIRRHCKDTGLISYRLHDHMQIKQKVGLQNADSEYCDDLFSFLCARQWRLRGHYGNKNLFSGFHEFLASRIIKATGFALSIVSVVLIVSLGSDIFILDKDIEANSRYAEVLENSYRQQVLAVEDDLRKAPGLESAVFMYDRIKQARHVSPLNFMTQISNILSAVGMNDVVLTDIEWQGTTEHILRDEKNSTTREHKFEYSSARKINQQATIRGYVRVSRSGVRQAVDKVNKMASLLQQNDQVLDLKLVHLPLDVRPQSSVTSENGANFDVKQDDSKRGQFEIRLLMQGSDA